MLNRQGTAMYLSLRSLGLVLPRHYWPLIVLWGKENTPAKLAEVLSCMLTEYRVTYLYVQYQTYYNRKQQKYLQDLGRGDFFIVLTLVEFKSGSHKRTEPH